MWFLLFALMQMPSDAYPELPPLSAAKQFPPWLSCQEQSNRWRQWAKWFADARPCQPWQEQAVFDRAGWSCREISGLWEMMQEAQYEGKGEEVRRRLLASIKQRIGPAAFERGDLPPLVRDHEMAPTGKVSDDPR